MIVIGNKRIIRFGVPVTYDANSAANRVLDKKEILLSINRFNFCSVNLRHASIVKPVRV